MRFEYERGITNKHPQDALIEIAMKHSIWAGEG